MQKLIIPQYFCWTKAGYEAGQELKEIIYRKNLERQSGNNIFMWGIGNSIEKKIKDLLNIEQSPLVLFSKTISKPKNIDIFPKRLCIWTKYVDLHGNESDIPANILVTSRFDTEKELNKTKHYAIVCRTCTELCALPLGWTILD